MGRKERSLRERWFTVAISSDIVPILDFSVVEAISELNPAASHAGNVIFRDIDNLLGIIVSSADGDIIEDVGDRGVIVCGTLYSDLPGYLDESVIYFRSTPQSMWRQEIRLSTVSLATGKSLSTDNRDEEGSQQ